MARGKTTKSAKGAAAKQRRWRINHIADWRKDAGLKQWQVADRLVEMGLARDRVTVTRIEGGNQMPPTEVLEAIAKIVGAPHVSAMVDYAPEQWARVQRFLNFDLRKQDRALRILEAVGDE